jgi:geranylgeranylglycerol-phosphate geranylgeranyltransferase
MPIQVDKDTSSVAKSHAGFVAEFVAGLVAVTRMVRLRTTIQAMLYTLLGSYLATGLGAFAMRTAWYGAFVVGLVVAFGFVFNDLFDIAADSFNNPSRPLPSRALSVRTAVYCATSLAACALIVAYFIGFWALIFTLTTIALGSAYSYRLKNTILAGNATIAVLDASIIVFGALSVHGLSRPILVLGAIIALYTWAEEILFTAKDVEGDRRAGLKTVATVWGIRGSLRTYLVVIVAFLIVAPVPWVAGMASLRYLVAIVLCTMIPVAIIAWRVTTHPTAGSVQRGAEWMKLIWLLSVVPILLFR